jgi:hypothetical protein
MVHTLLLLSPLLIQLLVWFFRNIHVQYMPVQLWKSKYLIFYNILLFSFWRLPWIPEPSTVNNKLKRREGSGSTGRFFD